MGHDKIFSFIYLYFPMTVSVVSTRVNLFLELLKLPITFI